MSYEVDEEESQQQTERLLAAKRHKEMKEMFLKLSNSLNQKKDDGISTAINKQSELIQEFLHTLQQQSPVQPNVNVEVNQKEVVSSIAELGTKILSGLAELQKCVDQLNQPKKWSFEVKRHQYTDLIISVEATNVYKSKYQA